VLKVKEEQKGTIVVLLTDCVIDIDVLIWHATGCLNTESVTFPKHLLKDGRWLTSIDLHLVLHVLLAASEHVTGEAFLYLLLKVAVLMRPVF
jgi:hypothetical protein